MSSRKPGTLSTQSSLTRSTRHNTRANKINNTDTGSSTAHRSQQSPVDNEFQRNRYKRTSPSYPNPLMSISSSDDESTGDNHDKIESNNKMPHTKQRTHNKQQCSPSAISSPINTFVLQSNHQPPHHTIHNKQHNTDQQQQQQNVVNHANNYDVMISTINPQQATNIFNMILYTLFITILLHTLYSYYRSQYTVGYEYIQSQLAGSIAQLSHHYPMYAYSIHHTMLPVLQQRFNVFNRIDKPDVFVIINNNNNNDVVDQFVNDVAMTLFDTDDRTIKIDTHDNDHLLYKRTLHEQLQSQFDRYNDNIIYIPHINQLTYLQAQSYQLYLDDVDAPYKHAIYIISVSDDNLWSHHEYIDNHTRQQLLRNANLDESLQHINISVYTQSYYTTAVKQVHDILNTVWYDQYNTLDEQLHPLITRICRNIIIPAPQNH